MKKLTPDHQASESTSLRHARRTRPQPFRDCLAGWKSGGESKMNTKDVGKYAEEEALKKVKMPDADGRLSTSTHAEEQFRVEVNQQETHGPLASSVLARTPLPCFLGLSPDTSFSNRGRLRAILRWLKPKTSRLTIAEGSFLTRWNLRALDGLSEQTAEEIAAERHNATSKRIAATVSSEFETMAVTVLDWPSVVRDSGFQSIRSQIENYAARNPVFGRGVVSVVDDFLSRTKQRGGFVAPNETQMLLLKSYVFEELAMFVHLYQAGFAVEVYPGDDLPLMRQLAVGDFDDFPFALAERTHVSIQLSQ